MMISNLKISAEKLQGLRKGGDMLTEQYGERGTEQREEFSAKARAWYYAELLKARRKETGITQKELAESIGKKREYIVKLEQGKTDMQLSTFLSISKALGLQFGLLL